jgi:hypothetical protein
LYAFQGNKRKALGCLEKALGKNEPTILRVYSNPNFDNLRAEPRFIALIKEMGLYEYSK